MGRNRAWALIIGVLVSAPLLAMQHFGLFRELAAWMAGSFESVLRLPSGGLESVLWLQYAYYTVMAFASAWLCLELPHTSRRLGFLLGAVFLTLTLSPVLALNGVLFEPFSGVLAVVLAGSAGMMLAGTEKSQRQHQLRRYFVGRLSNTEFERLLRGNGTEHLTTRREVSALTCRLLNHAALSREMEPADLEHFSSGFLKAVAQFLVANGGYLDECDVHRVRVLFGYPVANEDHALVAARVSLELRQRIVNLTQEMENRWHKKPRIGASISTGEVACGLFGFKQFEFFSAVGEMLEFGDRLSAVNEVYGSHLLVSAATLAATKDGLEVRPMEMVEMPHLDEVSEVYEVLGLKNDIPLEESLARDAFWQGVILLRRGDFEEALKQFSRATMKDREDAPLAYFRERAEAGLKKAARSRKSKPVPPAHVRTLLPI